MPNICCAARCFNKSSDGYALIRFPKENQYKKAWVDAVFGETSRSLNNLRLCEVHFEPSDVLVVGCRKEIKKGAIPSHFCHCLSENFREYGRGDEGADWKKSGVGGGVSGKMRTVRASENAGDGDRGGDEGGIASIFSIFG
ncbi:PREDICTED: uncharacterized protein LOC108765208 [Trachymyrmex cornetzi]|uniref:uncharacterized protein LOC108765208 n=1 Tax=Trachymyrmex cornetzi TaxID=471704 RepID=UPI00084EFBE2|nr:PREDICTED: uncharacterized protein LOC108765208 [Trachymyrmex cornetzi]